MTNDWALFLKIEVVDYPHAIRLEKHIKSMKSSKYISNLKKHPELIQKIVNKTSRPVVFYKTPRSPSFCTTYLFHLVSLEFDEYIRVQINKEGFQIKLAKVHISS